MKSPMSYDEVRRVYRGQRVAVLGASGFIGRWVARHLSDCGAHLYLIVRDAERMKALMPPYGIQGKIAVQDLSDLAGVRASIADIHPQIVFNLAGYGVDREERDAGPAHRINADLVQALAEAVSATQRQNWNRQRLVHVGSALEYGIATGDLAEDSAPRPTTLYGQTKLAGTQNLTRICQATGLQGVTARLFTVYGPGEHPNRLLPSLFHVAASGQPLDLTAGTQKRDFTFVADVADALLRLGIAEGTPGQAVNVASGRLTTVRTFVESAARVLGIEHGLLRLGAVPTRTEEMEHLPVSVKRLKQRTGKLPSEDIEAGIRQTRDFLSGGSPDPHPVSPFPR